MGWCCCTAATVAGGVVWAPADMNSCRRVHVLPTPLCMQMGLFLKVGPGASFLQATTWLLAAGCCYRASAAKHEHALFFVCQCSDDGLKQGAKSAAAAAAFISRANTHTHLLRRWPAGPAAPQPLLYSACLAPACIKKGGPG